MKNIFILVLNLILIFSCTSNDKKNCYTRSSLMNALVENYQLLINNESDISSKIFIDVNYQIVDSIKNITYELIEKSGGINTETGKIVGGCKPANSYYSLYKQRILHDLKGYIDNNGIFNNDNYKYIFNKFFYGDKAYFDKGYFDNASVDEFSSDLFMVQLFILNELLFDKKQNNY